ncbi:MAG TPA: polymorphic toxin-type HINT domain-containing protein [Phycisphaerae bacterium]|nr:polymorphic toxin-type HINT domain-containing protein [Phycisphaerae bacterium]
MLADFKNACSEVNVQLADGQTGTIDTTDSHPFYVEGEGWVGVESLQYGDQLESLDGQVETVLGNVY